MTIARLYEQHREIMRLSEALVVAARARPVDMVALTTARHLLAQATMRHLSDENRIALQPLATSSDPHDLVLARTYTDSLIELRRAGSAHNIRWTAAAIEQAPDAYAEELEQMLQYVRERRVWEEGVFLPAASRRKELARKFG